MTNTEIKSLLETFAAAWDARDITKVMACFDGEATYFASVGLLPGEKAVGHTAISKLVNHMFDTDKGSISQLSNVLISNNQAAWKWRYDFSDGSYVVGCDFFKFKDGRIALKDAYRKAYTS